MTTTDQKVVLTSEGQGNRSMLIGGIAIFVLFVGLSFVNVPALQVITLPLLLGFIIYCARVLAQRRRLRVASGVAPEPVADRAWNQAGYAPQNTLAVIAFVLAFFASIPAIVCGHIALVQISRTHERGRGLAIAALVMGYLGLIAVGVVVLVFAGVG